MPVRCAQATSPAPHEWRDRLVDFPLAPSELVSRRQLGSRCDTKFVLPPAAALEFVATMAADYLVLLATTEPIAMYRTLYFDTAALTSFHAHRCGRRLRHKVRVRHYIDRGISTLEVKTRRSEQLTTKRAQPHPFLCDALDAEARAFVQASSGLVAPVIAQAYTSFQRITLLRADSNERLTIDLDLVIEGREHIATFGNVAIVEVKQWPFSRTTPAMRELLRRGCRPVSVSKYCAAIACTQPQVRCNRLLPGLRALERGTR